MPHQRREKIRKCEWWKLLENKLGFVNKTIKEVSQSEIILSKIFNTICHFSKLFFSCTLESKDENEEGKKAIK